MTWSPDRNALRGRIALVTGATRGAGRGIAAALGEAGATVICTGRTTRSARSECNRPETIEETAELVTELGGHGIAAAVDHLDSEQVRALAERIRASHGHIDVLVNDIWGGELLKGPPSEWNTPIWRHDLAGGLRILRLAIDTHLITAHYLLPLLIERSGGLLVEVTDGTVEYNASRYRISVFYDLAKVSVNRLAFSMGHELRAHGATAVAITPGWLRSEMMLDAYRVSETNWRDAVNRPENEGPRRPCRLRALRIASIRRPGRRSAGIRSRSTQLESAIGQLGSTRALLRVHRSRRLPARHLALVNSEGGKAPLRCLPPGFDCAGKARARSGTSQGRRSVKGPFSRFSVAWTIARWPPLCARRAALRSRLARRDPPRSVDSGRSRAPRSAVRHVPPALPA